MGRGKLRRGHELDQLDEHSETRSTFERFNRIPKGRNDEGGLQDETAITVSMIRDGVRHYVHWRQYGAGILVEEEGADGWKESVSQGVTPVPGKVIELRRMYIM